MISDLNEISRLNKTYTGYKADNLSFEDVRKRGLENRKQLIVEAVTILIDQKLQEITLSDIAGLANISSTSVSRYFPKRTDLLCQALSRLSEIKAIAEKEE